MVCPVTDGFTTAETPVSVEARLTVWVNGTRSRCREVVVAGVDGLDLDPETRSPRTPMPHVDVPVWISEFQIEVLDRALGDVAPCEPTVEGVLEIRPCP